MKRLCLLAAMGLAVVFLAAVITGCGSNRSTPPPQAASTPAPTPSPTQITDIHLFAFLRTDGSTSGGPAPMSQQDLQAARLAAKANHAANRQAMMNADPGVNIYVWPFGLRAGWLPLTERKITASPGAYTSVHLAANDTNIVFSAGVNGYNQIFTSTVPAEGQFMQQPIQLTSDLEHHWAPHISADGLKVVFTKFDPASGGDVACFMSNQAGATETCLDFTATTPVLKGANLWHASWGPNSKIIFEAWGGSLNSDEIFMANADGSALSQISNNAGTGNYDECPSVNRDGTYMLVDTWNNTSRHFDLTDINLSTKTKVVSIPGDIEGDGWDPLYTYYAMVWVSQAPGDQRPQLHVMSFSPVPLSKNSYANYFENSLQ